jgi:8-oxo-dGTP pyrophosphatase MutT (NUDIX family)
MNAAKKPEAIPAATLILVRPHENGFKVYLLKRSPKSRFLPGVYVFPGGMVDPEDHGFERWKFHLDMDSESIHGHLGGAGFSTDEALPFALAAIRETFEEAGVWLAKRRGSQDGDLEALLGWRKQENLPTTWLMRAVEKQMWVLNLSKMNRWSHWITPYGMPYRYDTRFFLAEMPEDQVCRPDMKETVGGCWVTPREALEGGLSGEMPLSPPIVVTLNQLAAFGSFDELMDGACRRSWGEALLPRLIPLPQGNVVMEPWDPMYHEKRIEIETPPLESDVLPPEAPFSRIWYDGRLWRPVRFDVE